MLAVLKDYLTRVFDKPLTKTGVFDTVKKTLAITMKKLKLSNIKVRSFVVNQGKAMGGAGTIRCLTAAGGFTCEDQAGCGTIYTYWGGGQNGCEDTGYLTDACPHM